MDWFVWNWGAAFVGTKCSPLGCGVNFTGDDDGLTGKIWMNGETMGLGNILVIPALMWKNWTRKRIADCMMKALEDKTK